MIELMLVIAIIGILASLAVAAYQTHTVRDQVAEAVNLAGSLKNAVAEAFERTGVPPADRIDAGLTASPTESAGSYVSQVDIVNGRIDITFGNQAHPDITDRTLSLTPYVGPGGIAWRCGRAGAPEGQLMGEGGPNPAAYRAGDLDPRYLPAGCR